MFIATNVEQDRVHHAEDSRNKCLLPLKLEAKSLWCNTTLVVSSSHIACTPRCPLRIIIQHPTLPLVAVSGDLEVRMDLRDKDTLVGPHMTCGH